MAEVIGVRFKEVGKTYYFDPAKEQYKVDENVIVETSRGIEFGQIIIENRIVDDSEITVPLRPVIRRANEHDFEILAENKEKEKEAFKICCEKIKKHKLEMKLVKVEYTFDSNKILFYFSAENRVDFRELVKDLASVFKTRIELRQIGVRDQSKMLGGLGVCGRPFCCKTFLGDFQPVSVKMAKEQGLSLSPTKISGTCGRLMCCLKYEQETYEHLLRVTPKNGAIVETNEGVGTVVDSNLLTGTLKVKLDSKPEASPLAVDRNEVKLIKDNKIKLDKKELDALKNIE